MNPEDLKDLLEATAKKAVKEFVKNLKEMTFTLCFNDDTGAKFVFVDDIDNLITELYGGDEK